MKHKNKQFPRLMALFLTVMLLLGMFPGSVFAAEPETAPSTAATTETTTSTQPQENPSEAATVPSETIPPTEELTKPTEDVAVPASRQTPLLFGSALPTTGRAWDFLPLDFAHAGDDHTTVYWRAKRD